MTAPQLDPRPDTPTDAPPTGRSPGLVVTAILLSALGINALLQVPQFLPGWGDDPPMLSLLQALNGIAALAAGVGAWNRRRWAWIAAAAYAVLIGVLLASLGPLLDLDAAARKGILSSAAVAVLVCGGIAWYLRRATVALALVALVALAGPAAAQPALLDSLRPRLESAVTRGDWPALDPIIARLRTATRGPAARDAWTHYDLGYALHRRASALLLADRVPQAKPLLEEAEAALARAQALGGGGQALALRGAVTGQLAGTGGMMAGMRNGPRAFKQLDEALALAPDDPRVALLNGMTRLNAPRPFGGGPARGEPELRRAVALFAKDAARSPAPTWGRVDAHIWLAIALSQLDRKADARAELQKALALAPGHAWVTTDLLPKLDASR